MAFIDDYRVKTIRTAFDLAGIHGAFSYVASKFGNKRTRLIEVSNNAANEPFFIRMPSSDMLTYCQIFIDREYAFHVRRPPAVIIDAGANIGLSSIYFASRFPTASIIAIEPEESNFQLLIKNTASYRNVTAIKAALWNDNAEIQLNDPGLGNSGFMVSNPDQSPTPPPCKRTNAMTLDRIMSDLDIKHIDIMKVDIEGAEKEVFESPVLWIDKVDAFVVELHDRLRPGCSTSFNQAVSGLPHRWHDGENIFVCRDEGCLVRK